MFSSKKVIYDLGSNNGDDIPYYLKKSDLVVAVEANPILCNGIRERFSSSIQQDKLIVENVVLTSEDTHPEVCFYIHKTNSVVSQFPEPTQERELYDKVLLPSKSIEKIVQENGYPYYIKIDIEHYDGVILQALFKSKIFPPYISAEAHSPEILSILRNTHEYNKFKLVDGPSVSQIYYNVQIETNSGMENYSFPHHSAGPFGEDIAGGWMDEENFERFFIAVGPGWKDIHAKRISQ